MIDGVRLVHDSQAMDSDFSDKYLRILTYTIDCYSLRAIIDGLKTFQLKGPQFGNKLLNTTEAVKYIYI